jgi:hypothetical protein
MRRPDAGPKPQHKVDRRQRNVADQTCLFFDAKMRRHSDQFISDYFGLPATSGLHQLADAIANSV